MDLPPPFDDARTLVLALGGLGVVALVYGLESGNPTAVLVGGVVAGVLAGWWLRRWRR